jgi:hypothetical protein
VALLASLGPTLSEATSGVRPPPGQ